MALKYTKKGALKFRKLTRDEQLGLLHHMFQLMVAADHTIVNLNDLDNCILGTCLRDVYIQDVLNADNVRFESEDYQEPYGLVRDPRDPYKVPPDSLPLEQNISLAKVFQEHGLSRFLFGASSDKEDRWLSDHFPLGLGNGHSKLLELTHQDLAILRILTVADMVIQGHQISGDSPKKFKDHMESNLASLIRFSSMDVLNRPGTRFAEDEDDYDDAEDDDDEYDEDDDDDDDE